MKRLFLKRFRILMTASVLALGLCACQGKAPDGGEDVAWVESQETQAPASGTEDNKTEDNKTEDNKSEDNKTEESKTEDQSDSQSGEDTKEPAAQEPEQEEPKYKIASFEVPDTETFRMLRDMKIGWNLGNTFDAFDCTWLSNELDYESAWCGAKTTKELIHEVKQAGFNTVRIPVSWHNHLTDEKKYTISEAWLERVAEVVDYCMEEDMYVLLNIHHDNSESYMYPSNQYLEQSKKYVAAIWKQLADRFQDYDEHLLFDGMNEPRLVGHANEWFLNNSKDCVESVECINILNQTFVDTVRAGVGYNKSRYLVCPGYDASADGALNAGYVLPTDPVDNDNRIIISVHAYTPYNFALDSKGTDTWSSSNARDVSNMVGFMNNLYNTYISKGVPVIIDEFGAMEKNGNLESRIDFAGCYIANARARGITCLWWDNNVMKGNGERFGLIDRKTLQWAFPGLVEAMMEYAQ